MKRKGLKGTDLFLSIESRKVVPAVGIFDRDAQDFHSRESNENGSGFEILNLANCG